MPKMKTSATAKKRFKKSKSGLLIHAKAYRRKKLTNKTAKRKRNLGKRAITNNTDAQNIKKLLTYR
jgi:large subunit ribosomal protein L35